MDKITSTSEIEGLFESLKGEEEGKTTICICGVPGCSAWGGKSVIDVFRYEIIQQNLEDEVIIKATGCHGFCERGPLLVIYPQGIFYQQIKEEDIPHIVKRTIKDGEILGWLLYTDPQTGRRYIYRDQIPFYQKQKRRVFGLNGLIDPRDIMDYIRYEGYLALARVLRSFSPEDVIQEVEKAGLRGRGGAGFPTGLKWKFAREAPGGPKYVICNADEGDPGAFMDRGVLEGNPHAILEGMSIGAYAIGAKHGYIYVRSEYPTAIKHFNIAIEQAHELGLLGENILGTDFSFEIEIKEGAGAFVCGEETALIASIEGKRGMPRMRPPFPAQKGVWGKPTNINNVETWANVPLIILRGADWFSSLGTEKSKGTKILSMTGRINNTGLVEVPMGTSIRELIYKLGGGVPKGRQFKGVLMGGPSGGVVPNTHIDMEIDYEALTSIGSMMGSGGMIVLDENTCMVDLARFFLNFTCSESCGQCVPCRLGTKQMLTILTRITEGKGKKDDLTLLSSLANSVKATSLCGLGKSCPNPVLSTLSHFNEEYMFHVRDRRCPAATCDAMVISACQHACPAGIDVPNYVAFIAQGKYLEAVELIRERNPFPSICGRICIHPCELKCRRGELDQPVSIRLLKRFVSDWYFDHIKEPPLPFEVTKKERVAIVGAGPAGLTCAYFLAKMGYKTTVFEAQSVGGGMMGVAIPEFRLPRDVIKREVEYIEARGVEIRYNSPITAHRSVEDLLKEGFDAVFIAAGAQSVQRLGIAGEFEGLEGLYYGLKFLMDVRLGNEPKIGKRVAVVGGGNTAVDVGRTAKRLGAASVDLFEIRPREEVNVSEEELKEAKEEGLRFHFMAGPTRIISENNRVIGLELIRTRPGQMDTTGRSKPVFIEGSEFEIDVDTVIISIGQAPDLSFLPTEGKLERNKWGRLDVDEETLRTNVPGIFAGGDFTTGPTHIIRAIASGRRGALSIDKYLRGDTSPLDIRDEKLVTQEEVRLAQEDEEAAKLLRIEVSRLDPKARTSSFDEVEKGLTEEEARMEARRCLRCDLENR